MQVVIRDAALGAKGGLMYTYAIDALNPFWKSGNKVAEEGLAFNSHTGPKRNIATIGLLIVKNFAFEAGRW